MAMALLMADFVIIPAAAVGLVYLIVNYKRTYWPSGKGSGKKA